MKKKGQKFHKKSYIASLNVSLIYVACRYITGDIIWVHRSLKYDISNIEIRFCKKEIKYRQKRFCVYFDCNF